jgi:hypothetical protein
MGNPAGTDDGVSIPAAENTRNVPRMSGVIMRRKVGTKTHPWATKIRTLITVPSVNDPPAPQDDAIPAAKKPRLETYISTAANVGVAVGAAVHMTDTDTDTVTTASPSDTVAVAVSPTDSVAVTVAASSPTAGASSKRVRAPPRIWKPEEDAKLTEAVTEYGKNWLAVSALVPGRNNVQCHNRWINYVWPTIEGKNVSSGKWTSEEDAKLIGAVTKCGTNWIEVATGVPGRTKVQCSNRWANLGPVTINGDNAATGKWKKSEDVKMIEAVKKCGKDWVAVAALVPGRTNAQCCRRWAHVGRTVEGRL